MKLIMRSVSGNLRGCFYNILTKGVKNEQQSKTDNDSKLS